MFNLNTLSFSWGMYISKNGNQWVGQRFDPLINKGPPFSNNYHINMVHVEESGIYFSGLHTRALLRLQSDMTITQVCSLPEGIHNARPFAEGVIFNDTKSDVLRHVRREGKAVTVKVPSYKEEDLGEGNSRTVLSIPYALAPVKVAILPLVKKDGLPEKAREVLSKLRLNHNCQYDEKDGIGRRYRRQDAIGTPLCITIDHDSLNDDAVTVRERDGMTQERVTISNLPAYVESRVGMSTLF